MKFKTARFEALIQAAGKPEQVTLWVKPKAGSGFMNAVEQNRVATVVQRNVGAKVDIGMIGFELLPKAAFLVFPKPLPYAPGTRIVGIKYDRIAAPESKGDAPSRKSKRPSAAPPRVENSPKRPAARERLTHRVAARSDLSVLARMNQQLIQDENHRTRLSLGQLRQRMAKWLKGEYQAILFETAGRPFGYALFRPEQDLIYLRQFFIDRGQRRKGCGKEAIRLLREQVWPKDKRLTVDVLVSNTAAVAFWRAVGYRDYALTLEIMPDRKTG